MTILDVAAYALAEPDLDERECRRCKTTMAAPDVGEDATPLCNTCAHVSAAELATALTDALSRIDAIRAAAKPLRGVTWEHSEECPHRYCPNPNDCGGDEDVTDRVAAGCEVERRLRGGAKCSCCVAPIVALIAAIGEP